MLHTYLNPSNTKRQLKAEASTLGSIWAIHGWSIWDSIWGDAEEALMRRVCAYFTLEVFALPYVYLMCMVQLYKQRLGTNLLDVVYFKLAIDAHCHWNHAGHAQFTNNLFFCIWNVHITPPFIQDLVYCKRHARIKEICRFITHLDRYHTSTLHTMAKVQRPSQLKMITFWRRRRTLEGSLGRTGTMVERPSVSFH
jgi:hypothetical protein